MEYRLHLSHLVPSLPLPTLTTALKSFYALNHQFLSISTQSISHGTETSLLVNHKEVVKATGRSRHASETGAVRKQWLRLIDQASGEKALDTLGKCLGVPRKVYAEESVDLGNIDNWELNRSLCIPTSQSDTRESADPLVRQLLLAKELHQTLAERSQRKVVLATKAVKRNGESRADGRRSVANWERSSDLFSSTTSDSILPRYSLQTYRSLAAARFEAKSKQSKSEAKSPFQDSSLCL